MADNLSPIVKELFGRWQTIDGGLAMLAIYAFAFQIYCDFSGYTDAARGIAKCLGFELALELQPALLRHQPARFLEPVAHQPLVMAARLSLHSAGWQSRRAVASLSQPDADDDHRRPLAWRGVDVRHLGRLSRGAPGRASAGSSLARADRTQPTRWNKRAGRRFAIFATFHLVCFGWLIFASTSLSQVGGHALCDRQTPGDPGSVLPPAGPGDRAAALLWCSSSSTLSKDLNIISRTPWYVRSVFYTAVLLRVRARGRLRRAASLFTSSSDLVIA